MRAHVVSGFAAGQILNQACEEYGLVGEVIAIDEHPHVGPLKSDRIRHEWWRPLRDQYLDRLSSVMPGLEEQWHFALTRILDSAREVVIWSSDWANDQVHLRLAAAKLESFPGSVRLVDVPMRDGLAGVAAHYADTLAALGMRSGALSAGKRAALARDYRERLDNSEGVWFQTDRGLELAMGEIWCRICFCAGASVSSPMRVSYRRKARAGLSMRATFGCGAWSRSGEIQRFPAAAWRSCKAAHSDIGRPVRALSEGA